MTPMTLLTAAITLFAGAWLARPLWQGSATAVRFDQVPVVPRPASARWRLAAIVSMLLGASGVAASLLDGPARPAAGAPAANALHSGSPSSLSDPALAQAESRVVALVASLAARLKAHPDDADGWRTLARSYAALDRHASAVEAYGTAQRLAPRDATLLAEQAFSAAVLDPHATSGEPARLVARALVLDPLNPKALSLAGTLALDRKDYPAAVAHWERLARLERPGSESSKQLQFSILQARQLANLQGQPISLQASPAPGNAAAVTNAHVGGTVALAPALAGKVSPNDTVWVFARAPGAVRLPLAVMRKQVKDLPLQFVLDDRSAPAPSAGLSKAERVVVGARIAKSGNPKARNGDLQGLSPEVALGRDDLRVEINEVVRLR
jgi:cytochrome c-type biogenesis protein CcmH